jgi:hypothetical protein
MSEATSGNEHVAGPGFRVRSSGLQDRADTASRSRRAFRASFAPTSRPPRSEGAVLPQEGSRECRAPDAPAALRAKVESTQASHHGHAGSPGIPRAMVLTAYFALSPVTGLSCHRRRRNLFRQLDASVGASGPHDFAVRKVALSSAAQPASIASRPAFVTIASRPSVGRDGGGYAGDLGQKGMEIFLQTGLGRVLN